MFFQEIAMQDTKTPSLSTLLRVAKAHIPAQTVERCRQQAHQRWIQAAKASDGILVEQVRHRTWPGRVVASRIGDGHGWAGVALPGGKFPRAFVWLDAGEVTAPPSNKEFFAAELNRTLESALTK